MRRFFAVCICSVALLSAYGCRKQMSVIQDTSPKVDTTSRAKVDPFANVDTSGNAVFKEASLTDDLARQAAEALQTVYFDYNSFQLNSESTEKLQKAASFLKQNAGIRILIQGHCDERGSSEYNMGLGEKRAKAAREYLQNIGIESIRIETTSFGKEQPVQSYCTDDACHAKNRRDEFKVLAR